MIRTPKQVADELDLNRTSVTQMLARLGVKKTGGIFLVDEKTFEEIKSRKGKRGRPKLSKDSE